MSSSSGAAFKFGGEIGGEDQPTPASFQMEGFGFISPREQKLTDQLKDRDELLEKKEADLTQREEQIEVLITKIRNLEVNDRHQEQDYSKATDSYTELLEIKESLDEDLEISQTKVKSLQAENLRLNDLSKALKDAKEKAENDADQYLRDHDLVQDQLIKSQENLDEVQFELQQWRDVFKTSEGDGAVLGDSVDDVDLDLKTVTDTLQQQRNISESKDRTIQELNDKLANLQRTALVSPRARGNRDSVNLSHSTDLATELGSSEEELEPEFVFSGITSISTRPVNVVSVPEPVLDSRDYSTVTSISTTPIAPTVSPPNPASDDRDFSNVTSIYTTPVAPIVPLPEPVRDERKLSKVVSISTTPMAPTIPPPKQASGQRQLSKITSISTTPISPIVAPPHQSQQFSFSFSVPRPQIFSFAPMQGQEAQPIAAAVIKPAPPKIIRHNYYIPRDVGTPLSTTQRNRLALLAAVIACIFISYVPDYIFLNNTRNAWLSANDYTRSTVHYLRQSQSHDSSHTVFNVISFFLEWIIYIVTGGICGTRGMDGILYTVGQNLDKLLNINYEYPG